MKFNFKHRELGEVSETARGFQNIQFTDRNGEQCSLQQSSVATESLLWLGVDNAKPMILENGKGWIPYSIPKEVLLTTRMHLSRENVAGLVVVLTNWLFTDSFEGETQSHDPEGTTDSDAPALWQDELRRQIGELLRKLQETEKPAIEDTKRLLWGSKNPALFAAITGGSQDAEKLRVVIDVASGD